HRARRREAEQPGRPLTEVSRDLACGDELLEGGFCARKESFAGLGQPDTAGRADEERRADPRLECAHRLADRRWGHGELGSRSPKTAMLRNAEERFDAVERALPHCEVLLHSPSTLQRIGARWKQSYIRLADRERRRRRDPGCAAITGATPCEMRCFPDAT